MRFSLVALALVTSVIVAKEVWRKSIMAFPKGKRQIAVR
jgi:hypothetical protein